MSKQSEAKASQNYIPKAHNCGDCVHLQFDLVLPEWMRENPESWSVEVNGIEKNIRCVVGGFAVKKMGICGKHLVKDSK